MLVEDLVLVVDAVDSFLVEVGGGDVTVEILVGELGMLLSDLLADKMAEGDEDYLLRIVEVMGFERFDRLVRHDGLPLFVQLFLQFKDENGRAFGELVEVLVEGRDILPVREGHETDRIGVRAVAEVYVSEFGSMVDDDDIVSGQVDIAFAAPEAIVLGGGQGRDGIAGLSAGFAFPEAHVGDDCGLVLFVTSG